MSHTQELQNSNLNLVQVQKKVSLKTNKKNTWDSSKKKEIYFDQDEDLSLDQLPQKQVELKNNYKKNNSNLQQKQMQKTGSKIPTGTITRNFFDIESQEEYQQGNSPTKLLEKKQQKPVKKQLQKKNRNKIKLQPLKNANPQRVQIPESSHKEQYQEDVKQQKQKEKNQQIIKNKINNPENLKKIQKRKTNNHKLNFQISSSDQQPQQKLQQKPAQNQEQQIPSQNQSGLQHEAEHEHQQHSNQSQMTSPPIRPVIHISGCKQFMIKRDKQWLNKIWPQFNLHKMTNNLYTFSAKMTGNNASTTFTICQSQTDFIENGPSYLGKVKSNFIGNIINIYNQGYNPTDFKNNKGKLRDLLATVQYETNFFGSTRPRNFRVFILKPGLNYYEDLQGTQKGEDQVPLNELYDNQLNKQKILVMTNRKPEWNDRIKGFMLNFGGKVKKPSIKNFILEDEASPNAARLLFGKIDEDQFRLDIGDPISPIVGFGIALSTFGSKIGCQ